MNERIRDFSERLVDINCYHVGTRGLLMLTVYKDELRLNRGCGCNPLEVDAAGVDALLDALHCWKDTGGSFAALADTSNGVFTGKHMRASNGHEVKIIGPSRLRDHWDFREKRSDGSEFDWTLPADDLLPLVEQPKVQYRPMTPVEAAAHLGRRFAHVKGSRYVLNAITTNGPACTGQFYTSYDGFASNCTWDDDGSPCGIPEPTA